MQPAPFPGVSMHQTAAPAVVQTAAEQTEAAPLRVLLIDDEPLAVARLEVALRGTPEAQVVGQAHDGIAAAAAIAELKPDLVFLDVQMPGMSGLELARALEATPRPEIVFVTAFERYAPDAFEVEAADFLLKPVQFERLREAIDRAWRRRALRDQAERAAELEQTLRTRAAESPYDAELWAPSRNGLVRVPVGQIEWIEAARDYVLLHTVTRSYILRATMSALSRRLDPAVMLRVHRSAFVRLDAVSEVRRAAAGRLALLLASGVEVQVGSVYVGAVQQALKL
jgi:two-component system, LytTR family, response regulator